MDSIVYPNKGPKKNHTGKILGIAVIILLLIISIPLLLQHTSKSGSPQHASSQLSTNQSETTNIPLSTSTPTPTPQSGISSGTYTNSLGQFSLTIPSGWKLVDKQHPTDEWLETATFTNPSDPNMSAEVFIWDKHPKYRKKPVSLNDLSPIQFMNKSTVNNQTVYKTSQELDNLYTDKVLFDRPSSIVEIDFILKGSAITDSNKQLIDLYIKSLSLQ